VEKQVAYYCKNKMKIIANMAFKRNFGKKIFFLFFFFSFFLSSFAQKVCIGLFFDVPIKSLRFASEKTDYTLVAQDTIIVAIVSRGEQVQVSYSNGLVSINGQDGYSKVVAVAGDLTGMFSITPTRPRLEPRRYANNVTFVASKGNLIIINKVEENPYLWGVCEAEGGCSAKPDFFKAQAIISRTYLYAHFNRHAKDGFNLCDGVHCQAYHGLQTQCSRIRKAVSDTEGLLVIDSERRPITPTFYACCGGQTANSEDVWTERLPYLRSVKDVHCTAQRSATWQKRIPLADWKNFMLRNGIKVKSSADFRFSQPSRKKYYSVNKQRVELIKIRQYFRLRSTFFDVEVDVKNGYVILIGRGHGHGVGLCQEGAMQMAEKGYKYDKILKHYYTGTEVISFDNSQHINSMLEDYGDIFNPWLGRLPNSSIVPPDSTLSNAGATEPKDAEVENN
jgi:stage II sporulation protein D